MLKLVNLTISAKFGRITNFCIQFQLHVIQYLTTQWRWAMPAKFSDVELCQIDPPGSLNTIQHHTITFPLENIGQMFFNKYFE